MVTTNFRDGRENIMTSLDKTFCIKCEKKECPDFLTERIKADAKKLGIPLSTTERKCRKTK
jgi:hypothetical protein